ncbi:MAG: phosphate regulon transcriptional regulatory protein PhoB [Rhodospirillaceae bacterium]|nr:phosphate regulon transcriptional regulatory protein PhoB [Rhodospirillaceae bacterium]
MPYAPAEESPLVLIVEDEEAIITLLDYNLRNAGYLTAIARDGEEAVDLARSLEPNAILLDWMLPLRSGLEVCRHLRRARETSEVPIIMLTARGEEQDKLRGLDMGADDYLTKPFSPQELLARLRAVIRRAQPARLKEVLTFDTITMDQGSHRVTRSGRLVELAPTEFRLLRHFLQYPGRVFSREQLLDAVWGREKDIEARTVDVHIRRLRKALNESDESNVIRTVREVGYALDLP